MNRLFVGIFLPDSTLKGLEELCYGLEGAKWQAREKQHITLEFLGKVEGQMQNDIASCLSSIHATSFDAKVKGLGHFPLRKNPGVLWAGVEPSEELISFQSKIHNALKRIPGLKLEARKYHPHITLARIREVADKDVAQFYEANPLFSLPEFRVQEFVLVKSTLNESGSRYEALQNYALTPD